MPRVRALLPVTAFLLAVATGVANTPASASTRAAGSVDPGGHGLTVVVGRNGPTDRSVLFRAAAGGEALVRLTAAAPGIDWARPGAESAAQPTATLWAA